MLGRATPAVRALTVTRDGIVSSYTVRQGERYVAHLNFRQVEALCAVRKGSARMVLRTRRASYFDDIYLDPECDAFGIGAGTLGELQDRRFIEKTREPGPLALTPDGDTVLDAILRFVAAERRRLARTTRKAAHA